MIRVVVPGALIEALEAVSADMARLKLCMWERRLAEMTDAGWQLCFPVGELSVAVTGGGWTVRRTEAGRG